MSYIRIVRSGMAALFFSAVLAGAASAASFSAFSRFDVQGFDNLSGFDAYLFDANYFGGHFASGVWSIGGTQTQLEAGGDYGSVADFKTHRACWSELFPANRDLSFDFDYKVRLKVGSETVANHTFRWNVSTYEGENGRALKVDMGAVREFAFDWGGSNYVYEMWGATNNRNVDKSNPLDSDRVDTYDYDVFDNRGASYWKYVDDSHSWVLGAVRESAADPVPEPASLLLLGCGIAGAGLIRRRRK